MKKAVFGRGLLPGFFTECKTELMTHEIKFTNGIYFFSGLHIIYWN